MKKKKTLIILIAVMAVCVCAAIIVSHIDFDEKMTGTVTTITDLDETGITHLSWKYTDEVSFSRDSSDSEWTYDADDKMPADQDLLNTVAASLAHITSNKRVDSVASLSVYGLGSPEYTLSVGTDSETVNISIGNESFSDNEVYISIGDEYVYMVDSSIIDDISYGIYDLVQKEEIPEIELESISDVKIENGESLDIIRRENSGLCYSDAYLYYLDDNGTYKNLDNSNAANLFSSVASLSWSECVAYGADDDVLEEYGLKEPAAEIAITYTDDDGAECVFSYDVSHIDDSYYARLAGSDIIYTVGSAAYTAAVEDGNYNYLKPSTVILLDSDTIDSVVFTVGSDSCTVTLERTADEDNEGETVTKYYIGDTEVDISDILSSITALKTVTIEAESGGSDEPEADASDADSSAEDAEDEAEAKPEVPVINGNETEFKVTFNRNTEKNSTVTMTIYRDDGLYCISKLSSGGDPCYVNRSNAMTLKEKILSFILENS